MSEPPQNRIPGRKTYRRTHHGEEPISQSSQLKQKLQPQSASNNENDEESDYESDLEQIQEPQVAEDDWETSSNSAQMNSFELESSATSIRRNNCSKTATPGFIKQIPFTILFLCAAVIVIASALIKQNHQSSNESETIETKIIRKNCSYDILRQKYPKEDKELWQSLEIVIEGILNEQKPSPAIYLFLHNNTSSAKKLIKALALRASECFDPDQKPIEITAKDFASKEASDDYGVIVELYKTKVKEGSVTIIANLNEIPPKAAPSLHSICDTYSPIIHKAVIFLSLKPQHQEESALKMAENTLFDLWSPHLTDFELDPLITRVTDQVFKLNTV